MAEDTGMTREERLAAKLRENLRRRKSQARALDQDDQGDSPVMDKTKSLSQDRPLSKDAPSR